MVELRCENDLVSELKIMKEAQHDATSLLSSCAGLLDLMIRTKRG